MNLELNKILARKRYSEGYTPAQYVYENCNSIIKETVTICLQKKVGEGPR